MTHRILLVEDEPDIARVVRMVLVAPDFVVIDTAGVVAARALFASPPPPDLVILDLVLPDGDGLDLCREVKRSGEPAPVLVVTARPDQREAALAAGADAFLVKPFEPDELEREVRRLVGGGRARS